ncbi:MAG: protein phosphatase 2C domain-containing protein [Saccharofermentans sp.]|nr:protein phosphatase 2C domain-containing protein [Saccharofermentans sp.]
MKYLIDYKSISNIGGRPVNEDSVGEHISNELSCFILCDGLGGHGMGDKASQLVRDVFNSCFNSMTNPKKELGEAFIAGQHLLTAEQEKLRVSSKMKTTASALVLDKKKAYIGFVGDSRVYVFGEKGILKRTLDHSVPQMLALAKDIDDKDIRNHPDRSSLLKVMGTNWDESAYEILKPMPLRKCKGFLLCSDGFWELIEDEEMFEDLISSSSAEEWLEKMNSKVQKRGKDLGSKMDNNSAIAVMIDRSK